jgi:hypothetical protein
MPEIQRRGTVFRFLGAISRRDRLEPDVAIAWPVPRYARPAVALDNGGHNGDVLERDIVQDGRDRVPGLMNGDRAPRSAAHDCT